MSKCKPNSDTKNIHFEMVNDRVVTVSNGMSFSMESLINISKEIDKIKAKEKVVVMHPSCALLVKDRISSCLNPVTLEYEYKFQNMYKLFISSHLPIDNFCIMPLGKYNKLKAENKI